MSVNSHGSAPTVSASDRPISPERPLSALVIGILNIVFGVLDLCGTGFGLIMLFIPAANRPNPLTEIMANSPGYRIFLHVATGVGVIAVMVLITSGVGLVQRKSFGRTLAIAYGIYGLGFGLAVTIVNMIFAVGPLLAKAANMPNGPEKGAAIGGAIGGTVGGCFGIVYAIVLLVIMYQPRVIEAYRARV